MHATKKLLLSAAVLVAMGAGCAKTAETPVPEAPAAKQSAATRPEDAIYVIDGSPVTLLDGVSIVKEAPDSAGATVTRLFGEPRLADLDADGDMDAAVMLSVDSPGSGTFYYVAAAIKEDWGFRGTDAFLMGDRVAPQTLEIHDALIVANYAEREPGEPMTARPSMGVSKYLRIESGELKETEQPQPQPR